MTKPKESKKYQLMLTEVEKIVDELSNEEIDLDDMVQKVERGYKLITDMKIRLDETKGKIENLRAQFEENPES